MIMKWNKKRTTRSIAIALSLMLTTELWGGTALLPGPTYAEAAVQTAVQASNLFPASGYSSTPISPDISVTLGQPVELVTSGSYGVSIRKYSDNTEQARILGSSMELQNNGKKLVIAQAQGQGGQGHAGPINSLEPDTKYYITIDKELLKPASNAYIWDGLSNKDQWNFTTVGNGSGADTEAPQLLKQAPVDKTSNVLPENAKLQLTFNEPVETGKGSITIMGRASGSGSAFTNVANLDIPGDQVTGTATEAVDTNGTKTYTVNISLQDTLKYGWDYQVGVNKGAFLDLSGNESDAWTAAQWSFSTAAPLQAETLLPALNQRSVPVGQQLKLSFNKNIALGKGTISIKQLSNNAEVAKINVDNTTGSGTSAGSGSSVASISGSDLTITHPAFTANTTYYVLIDKGTILGEDGSLFAGYIEGDDWLFSTQGDAVKLTALQPANGGSSSTLTPTLKLTFDRNVTLKSGTIRVSKSDGTVVEDIPVTSSKVTGGGTSVISIKPAATLAYNTRYLVSIPDGTLTDTDGNLFPRSNQTLSWSFTTAANTSALTLSSLSPAAGSSSVPISSDLTMTYNRSIQRGTGSISLRKVGASADTAITVSINAAKAVIHPASLLEANSTYTLTAGTGAFLDASNSDMWSPAMQWSFSTAIADTTAPVLQSTQMYTNDTIRLQYNEAIDSSMVPLITSFSATVNGDTRAVSSVWISGSNVYVVLSTGVAVGQNVRLSYSAGTRPIRDYAGNSAASFGLIEVVNGMDTALPKPREATVYTNSLIVYFNDTIKTPSTSAYSQFQVTADGSGIGVNSLYWNGSYLTLNLSRGVTDGQVVKLSYAPGSYPLQDLRGQNVSAFTDFFVRNTLDSKPPVLEKAEATGSTVLLTYNEALREDRLPAKNQFSVLSGSTPDYVTAMEIKSNTIKLTLASSLSPTVDATVSYVPGSSGFTDLNGNMAGYLNLVPITISNGAAVGLTSGTVKDNGISLTFNKTLQTQSSVTTGQFIVKADGTAQTVQSGTVSGSVITLKLAQPVAASAKVEVSYTPGSTPIKESTGSNLGTFSGVLLQNQGSTTGNSGSIGSQPSYLEILGVTEFNRPLMTMKLETAALSSDVSHRGKTTQRYTIDGDKLNTAYNYVITQNNMEHGLIFKVPTAQPTASVEVPMTVLQNAYGHDNKTSIGIVYGNTLMMIALKDLKFTEISTAQQRSLSDLYLVMQIESLASSEYSGITQQTAANALVIHSQAVDLSLKVQPKNGSSSGDLTIPYEAMLRTGQLSSTTAASIERFDLSTDTITYVPATSSNAGGYSILKGKMQGSTIAAIVTGSRSFLDVSSHWARTAISDLASRMIIDGTSAIYYSPNQNITRRDFAIYLAKGLGLDGQTATAAQRFSDISASSQGSAYIGAVAKAGIITGYVDGSFKPDNYITREQMAIMMVRAMNYSGYQTVLSSTPANILGKFKDVKSIQTQDTVAKAVQNGIISGVTVNTFQPAGKATRAQAAIMLQRVLRKIGYLQ
ncbi:Ig-like domain-containing protein [Paenibacillus sp. JX-17]|uniref:Ig-like domain-containing protein n=1 Tax=Paenibacillus lacisoli TaxID=3064525 RepID=A0ABT9CD18_9BACL|nr:Ig-like domain-containing protein [Paenibacillus sp. JX-17]MDO7906549.1 Ig-like domain-containing protein [Paenibacillus sp. JX-17]